MAEWLSDHQSISIMSGWVALLFVLSLVVLIVVLFVLRFYNWQLKRSFQATALIRSIHLPANSSQLEIKYEFRHRGQSYCGKGQLSPDQLLGKSAGQPNLTFHKELDMPVLYWNHDMYVGIEAIEHVLIEKQPQLRIRFLSADPTRNFPIPSLVSVAAQEHKDSQV